MPVLDPGGDVFGAGDPPHGICFAPGYPWWSVAQIWTRLDDPSNYRLATSYTIDRGRSSETDKTGTGTATLTFRDTDGTIDMTNALSPFAGDLTPTTQAAIALQNPVTGDWFTLFRGYIAEHDHQLEMFTDERGLDAVSWPLVDAFDMFANTILTRGSHGNIPDLVSFPNIYYDGVPSNLAGVAENFSHVDQRIVKLLDDAGWSGTGNNFDTLRNIFSGNVSVQGTVYSRKDSLLSALYDAADAEFPGIANIFMSKEGVVTFHGRYARFFPTRPGYGINFWTVGSLTDAAVDDTLVPLAGPLNFYMGKDDIINVCTALPQNVDETDGGVVIASDSGSIDQYGYRSQNFDGLIVSAGHDDTGATTSAVVETNKFAAYYVGNYKDPKIRCGTLVFRARGIDTLGAPALWDMMTRVEIGDVVTLLTEHPGGPGFQDQNFYVEHIHYDVRPARDDMLDVTMELEVSPATYFGYNPFGTNVPVDS
jgi:hypothetical protein